MKHSRVIVNKYKALLAGAVVDYDNDCAQAKREHQEKIESLKSQRQCEIDALPEVLPKPRNLEDLTIRHCASCGYEMLTATKKNARRFMEATQLRGGEVRAWQYALTGLRNRSRRYCCYHCQITRGAEHSARCSSRSTVANTLRRRKNK